MPTSRRRDRESSEAGAWTVSVEVQALAPKHASRLGPVDVFATQVAASGQVSLRTLQEWMGHCDAKTTQIYADYMPGEREAELIDLALAQRHGPFMDQSAQNTPSATPR
jgi:integrase